MIKRVLFGASCLWVLLSASGTSFAAGANSTGLRVSPVIDQIQLNSVQTNQVIDQVVTNVSEQPLSISVHPQDFGSIGQAGTINFYPINYKASNNPHGLQNSVQLATTQFVLAPEASQTEQVTINNVSSLAIGGHYGAIIYAARSLSVSGVHSKVSLIPSVASLIFLATSEGGTQDLHITNVLQSSLAIDLPKTVSFVIANSGNTQSTPVGYISLYDPSGKLIAQSILNRNSLIVLPGSSILMNVSLPNSSTFFARPGEYHLKIVYEYAGSNKLITLTKNFYYLNVQLILLALAVLTAIIWIIKTLKNRRRK